MAKGRKDSGELYEVFRKITAQGGEQGYTAPAAPLPPVPENPAAPQVRPDASRVLPLPAAPRERAFLIRYDTAVIIFIAFILGGLWLYYRGYSNGKNSVIQRKSQIDSESILYNEDTDITTIPLAEEKGGPDDDWTVQVVAGIPSDKLESLDKNIRKPLELQGYVTFVARSDEAGSYVLWVNRFPRESIAGDKCLEKMRDLTSKSGTKAFKEPRLVAFDQNRVVTAPPNR